MPEQIFHIRTLAWHIVFTLCLPALLFAQPSVIYTEEEAEAYNDLLRDLEGISLELNRASAKDLLILPGLTPELARRIIARRPYRTLAELAHVQGLSEEHIDLIAPYLSIAPLRPWRLQYKSRVTRPSKRANSFGDMRLYQRLEIASPARLSAFFLTERDPEEPTLTDYVTGYIALPLSRVNIILGDVRPEWGQGLLFSRRTRSAVGLSYARARTATQLGNRTSTEHGALRGIYLSGSHTRLIWSLMHGQMTWDATFGSDTRIYTSGLHDTETSQARKNALREHLTGANIAIGSSQKHIGLTVLNTAFNPVASDTVGESAVPRTAREGMLFSLNAFYRADHIALFGEIAPKAFITGLVAGTPLLRLHLIGRYYGANFHSLHGAPYAAYSSPPNNEWGAFFGLTWRISKRKRLDISLDRHGHLAPEKSALPERGARLRLNFTHRFSRGFSARLTADARSATNRVPRQSLRLALTYKRPSRAMTAWLQRAHAGTSGNAAGLRLQLGKSTGFSLALWATHHKISSYNARIYDVEPDVWGGIRLLTLSGDGTNRGLRLTWGTKHFRLSARYSHHRTSSWSAQLDLKR